MEITERMCQQATLTHSLLRPVSGGQTYRGTSSSGSTIYIPNTRLLILLGTKDVGFAHKENIGPTDSSGCCLWRDSWGGTTFKLMGNT